MRRVLGTLAKMSSVIPNFIFFYVIFPQRTEAIEMTLLARAVQSNLGWVLLPKKCLFQQYFLSCSVCAGSFCFTTALSRSTFDMADLEIPISFLYEECTETSGVVPLAQ